MEEREIVAVFFVQSHDPLIWKCNKCSTCVRQSNELEWFELSRHVWSEHGFLLKQEIEKRKKKSTTNVKTTSPKETGIMSHVSMALDWMEGMILGPVAHATHVLLYEDDDSQDWDSPVSGSGETQRKSTLSETSSVTLTKFVPPNNPPVTLSWSNLSVTTKLTKPTKTSGDTKILLNNISGVITSGMWAVMGGSGSGKTTLLSALSRRLDTRVMSVSGQLLMDHEPYTKRDLKNMSGYVMQDDLVHAHFTVLETLLYASELRMDIRNSPEDRHDRIMALLGMLGLLHCQDTIVGDSRNKGVSGGERKRLCVAIELLTCPSLLFLDEPTSGKN